MRAILRETRELTPEVRHFVFEIEGVEHFDFTPGQFVSLHHEIGGKQITRAYSLAAPPEGNRVELCLNRVESGHFSPYLFSLALGDAVELTGPVGYFVPRPMARTNILVATGTGIAPYRAMLPSLVEAGRPVTLIFGTRHEETILYREEWENWEKQHNNFRFWPTLSRAGDAWTGRRGYVQASLAEALGGSLDADVFICGLRAMVDQVRALAKSLGLDRKQIVYEKYD
jgi:CDP-4-dehydro-6-deoxyglucose reductase